MKYLNIAIPGICLVLLAGLSCSKPHTDHWEIKDDILSEIVRPQFRDTTISILDYGAVADSIVNSTEAIRKAIMACHLSGGGTVVVPEGTFYTGAIHLKSNVNLHLVKGAVLKFSTRPEDYLPLVHSSWSGAELMNYSPLIYAYKQENIALTGKGMIDGQSSYDNWWIWNKRKHDGWEPGTLYERDSTGCPHLFDMVRNNIPVEERIFGPEAALRPHFVQFFDCRNVLIEGLTVIRSPFWVIHPIYCTNVIVEGLTIKSHGPNNDGCDPEYCKNVWIKDCLFDTGDDCIAIKSGRDDDGRRAATPTENVIIQGCTMYDGHGGVVIGSETACGVRNIFIENCIMSSPNLDNALRVKSNSKRGSLIENIYMRNIEIGQVKEAVFKFNMKYGTLESADGNHIPVFRNIFVKDIHVINGGKTGILVTALEASPVRNFHFTNIIIDTVEQCLSMDYYENIQMDEFYCNEKQIR